MFPFQIQDENPSATAYNTPQVGSQVFSPARGVKYLNVFAPTATPVQVLAANPLTTGRAIQNTHATVDCYLGRDSTVTSLTGFFLAHGTTFIDYGSYDAWWAVTASSTGEVRTIEMTN